MKQAIRELNEAKEYEEYVRSLKKLTQINREKDMKEDRYEFPLDEWQYDTEPEPFELPAPTKLIVTRKKPKVKVEWSNVSRFGDGMGENGIDFTRHGYERYHIVQFRVTGHGGEFVTVKISDDVRGIVGVFTITKMSNVTIHLNLSCSTPTYYITYSMALHSDARDKWSAPVLLPESIYSKLDDICRALEQKANEVKG